jgi:gamma-glutamyltranspeptidase / glutathione hydrolase
MKKLLLIILGLFIVVGIFLVYRQEGIFINSIDKLEQTFDKPKPVQNTDNTPAYGVSANHPIAVEVGMNILENGGNAVDAAVAITYTLGVVEPYASGIGGGGEMLIYFDGKEAPPIVYQYKDVAPNSSGIPQNNMGIPGLVKGMERINEDLGTMPIDKLIEPAIQIAKDGFKVDSFLVDRLTAASYRLPVSKLKHFFPNEEVINEHQVLKQPELAETLTLIQKHGSEVFYNGEIAEDIIKHVGNIKKSDLKEYSVVKTKPVEGEFLGYKIYSAPPPLSGITLIQILQMADLLNKKIDEENKSNYVHLIGEISKRAYNDRLSNIGDPKFFKNQIEQTTSKEYAEDLIESINISEISADYQVIDAPSEIEDYDNTTHFVVIDKDGMIVSATNTLGNFFGSGDYVRGFFLNNSMSNFSQSASSPNSLSSGKTPRSFTSPTILVSDQEIIGIGTPGGKRIPIVLAQVLIQYLMFENSLQNSIDEPRFYIEGNTLYVENGFSKEVRKKLTKKGYNVYIKDSPFYFGGVQALILDKKNEMLYGGADPRRNGTWSARREK